jgi:hypothetical protein
MVNRHALQFRMRCFGLLAAIRRNPIKCLLCVKRAKCPVNLDAGPQTASPLSSVEVFFSFASGMVRMSKESLRCLAVYLVKLKSHAKVLEATHLSTRAQHSCGLSVIIIHPRVIKSTLRSTIERV